MAIKVIYYGNTPGNAKWQRTINNLDDLKKLPFNKKDGHESFKDLLPNTFEMLSDTPGSYGGAKGMVLVVREDEQGIEFLPMAISFLALADVSAENYEDQAGKAVVVRDDEAGLEFGNAGLTEEQLRWISEMTIWRQSVDQWIVSINEWIASVEVLLALLVQQQEQNAAAAAAAADRAQRISDYITRQALGGGSENTAPYEAPGESPYDKDIEPDWYEPGEDILACESRTVVMEKAWDLGGSRAIYRTSLQVRFYRESGWGAWQTAYWWVWRRNRPSDDIGEFLYEGCGPVECGPPYDLLGAFLTCGTAPSGDEETDLQNRREKNAYGIEAARRAGVPEDDPIFDDIPENAPIREYGTDGISQERYQGQADGTDGDYLDAWMRSGGL